MKPRIAIPAPTSRNTAYNDRSWPNYAEAVRAAGGEPVLIPLDQPTTVWKQLARECAGVLLPGSPADVEPARFGAERDPATAAADPEREAVDFALLDDAEASGKPVLGICFGCQSMNVWAGGSLVQDLSPLPVNHSAGREVAVAHTALVARPSLLGDLVDPAEGAADGEFLRLPVNTSHHQAVSAPGENMRVVSRSPEDGVVEAIERSRAGGAMFLGVQWHPERSTDISQTSRNLFRRLVEDAARWSPR